MVVHCSNLLVPLHLNSTPKTIIKFDLWMSKRQHDIFGLIINFLTINWESSHVTIGLLIDNDTTKHGLARELEAMSKSFHFNYTILCCVKNENTNLGNITMTVKLVIPCEALTLSAPFDGACFGHAINKAMNS